MTWRGEATLTGNGAPPYYTSEAGTCKQQGLVRWAADRLAPLVDDMAPGRSIACNMTDAVQKLIALCCLPPECPASDAQLREAAMRAPARDKVSPETLYSSWREVIGHQLNPIGLPATLAELFQQHLSARDAAKQRLKALACAAAQEEEAPSALHLHWLRCACSANRDYTYVNLTLTRDELAYVKLRDMREGNAGDHDNRLRKLRSLGGGLRAFLAENKVKLTISKTGVIEPWDGNHRLHVALIERLESVPVLLKCFE